MVDPARLVRRLDPTLAERAVEPFGSGWDHSVWAVGDDLVLRVEDEPDADVRRRAVERDLRILDLVARHVTVEVGGAVAADPERGALLLRRVRGRSIAEGGRPGREFDADVAELLGQLRSVPSAAALEVSGPASPTPEQWLEDVRHAYDSVAGRFPPGLRDRVENWLGEGAPAMDGLERLCHNDLGDEHLFVDEAGRLSGVIDWTDSVAGDPARDVAMLRFDLGGVRTRRILESAGWDADPELRTRARWFAVRAGVAGICHRLSAGLGGVEEQAPRLESVLSGQ